MDREGNMRRRDDTLKVTCGNEPASNTVAGEDVGGEAAAADVAPAPPNAA
jgi:hypothetical protein